MNDLEESHKRLQELLKQRNIAIIKESYTREKFIDIVTKERLDTIKRIEFNTDSISNNMIAMNQVGEKFRVVITDERGQFITDDMYDNAEEAYGAVVSRLRIYAEDF